MRDGGRQGGFAEGQQERSKPEKVDSVIWPGVAGTESCEAQGRRLLEARRVAWCSVG